MLGHYFGWRSAYWVGVVLTGLLVVLLPMIMERKRDEAVRTQEPPSYSELLRSLWPMMRTYPEVTLGGYMQALSFGLFLALWLAIGLHLPAYRLWRGYSRLSCLHRGDQCFAAPYAGNMLTE